MKDDERLPYLKELQKSGSLELQKGIEEELKAKYDDLRKHLRSVNFENPLDYHTESDIWEPITDTLYDPERNISLKRS